MKVVLIVYIGVFLFFMYIFPSGKLQEGGKLWDIEKNRE